MSASLPCIGQEVWFHIFSHFHLCLGSRKSLEDKTYTVMDLPTHGEPDGM